MLSKKGMLAVFTKFVAQTFTMAIVFLTLGCGINTGTSSAGTQRSGQQTISNKKVEDMTSKEKQARMNELLKKKQEMDKQKAATGEVSRTTGQGLNDIITRNEKLLEQCAVRKSDRCADVMFILGSLYINQAEEKTPPDYSKSLRMYWQLTREYPQFNKLPETFTQMAKIYFVVGHLDSTRIVLEQLVQRFPNNPHISSAHFRLGDLAVASEQYDKAYNHFLKIKENEVGPAIWEETHYLLGKCTYHMSNYNAAIRFFDDYIKQYNRGKYKNKELYNAVLEYMSKAKNAIE